MTFSELMLASLPSDPLTFQDGIFTITIGGCSANGDEFRIASCVAMVDGVIVFNDDVLLVNAPAQSDSLAALKSYVALMVRERQ